MSVQRRQLLESTFVALVTANDRLNRAVAAFMKTWGITGTQYNVLRILRGAGPDGQRSQRIADDMISKVPDITRLVDRLVTAGLAERRTDADDRRVVKVVVTASGLDLLARMDEPIRALHEQVLGGMTSRDLKIVRDLLGEL